MRLAIGAGRVRLIRQLLTESLLLAAGGGVAGVALGYVPIALAKRIKLPGDPPPVVPLDMNERVLLFSVAIALVSVILFGLMPAFQATRTDLMTAMKGAGGLARRHGWMGKLFRGRNVLVAGQVAMSVLLLTTTTVLYVGAYKTLLTSIRTPSIEVNHLLALDFRSGNGALQRRACRAIFQRSGPARACQARREGGYGRVHGCGDDSAGQRGGP